MKNTQRICLGLACSALLVCSQAWPQAAAPTLSTFAYKTQIDLPAGGGPFYQFTLPIQAYQGAQRQDLGDMRIFNGQGEIVPHSLLRPHSSITTQDSNTTVPVFPITQSHAAQDANADVTLDVQRKSDGTLIAVNKNKSGKEVTQVQGAIFDLSHIKENVRALHLDVAPSNTPFHSLSIDTSDDLQQWQTLQDHVQLVHLQQGGQVIDKNTFDWEGRAGKYLRVLWRDPAQAPAILSASVTATRVASTDAKLLWTDAVRPGKSEGSNYEYAIGGQIPWERLRIGLAQVNTLAPLQVQRSVPPDARHPKSGWESLTQSVVYRLQSQQEEVNSPDLELNGSPAARLRLVFDASGGGIGNVAPIVQVGFVPQKVIFLPRGSGPFTLAWGASNVPDSSMPAATLLPNYDPDRDVAATPATLQVIAAIPMNEIPRSATEAEGKTSKTLLWSVLAVGLLILAGMVVMLLRQMRQGADKP